MSQSQISQISERICNELDFEIILKTPHPFQVELAKNIQKKRNREKDEWLATQFLDFLRGWNDKDIKPISILLTPYINGKEYQIKREMRLKNELSSVKSRIDDFIGDDKEKEKYYASITTLLDPFANFRRHVQKVLWDRYQKKASYITNAFLKCWEMIYTFQLIPYHHSPDYTVFCNAEFPGAFIFAINKYITEETKNPNYKWYANSLYPDKKDGNILGDQFNLYEKYYKDGRWLMDEKENDGNVTKLKTIDEIRKKLGDKVDLYTSDIGIGLDQTNFNKQEELEAILNLGQVLCALSTMKKGACMVCKMFLFFTPFNISLLSMLNDLFDEFYLSKPVTSRPGNSEIYIVGKGYHGYQSSISAIEELRNALGGWNENSVNTPVAEIREEFYAKIINSAYQIYKRQMHFVGMNIEIAKRCFENGIKPYYNDVKEFDDDVVKKELALRKRMFDEWKWEYNGSKLYIPTRKDL